jgi:hypothetical protein
MPPYEEDCRNYQAKGYDTANSNAYNLPRGEATICILLS